MVLGIRLDNSQEVLAFKLTSGESEAAVTPILNDLYRRGLEGKNSKIVASDGAEGIKAAIETVYPYAKWQLCSTHKMRNLCSNIEQKKKHRKEMLNGASLIYESATRKEAVIKSGSFCSKWESVERKAVKNFRKDFSRTLTFYEYAEDRRFVSTANRLERDLEEIRRRIKTQGYFKNERSVDLWVYGILKYPERIKEPEGLPLSATEERTKELEYESAHNS